MKLGVETIWQDRKRVLGMPLTFTKYFLSEDRLFLQTGVLNMKMEEVLLYRVSDIGRPCLAWPAHLRRGHDHHPFLG